MLRQHYSLDLLGAVAKLLSGAVSASQMCSLVSTRVADELDLSLASVDALHAHLRSEYENSR